MLPIDLTRIVFIRFKEPRVVSDDVPTLQLITLLNVKDDVLLEMRSTYRCISFSELEDVNILRGIIGNRFQSQDN